jgi:hypothetical protein
MKAGAKQSRAALQTTCTLCHHQTSSPYILALILISRST